MKIGVNDGHTLSGAGTGAVGVIKEGEHTRLVGEEVRRLLKEKGIAVFNCTVDYAETTNESLSLVVQQANREDLDWFISIHFNAGGGKGVEVYTYEGRQYQDAIDEYGEDSFRASIGAEALKEILASIDLEEERNTMRAELKETNSEAKRKKLVKR